MKFPAESGKRHIDKLTSFDLKIAPFLLHKLMKVYNQLSHFEKQGTNGTSDKVLQEQILNDKENQ